MGISLKKIIGGIGNVAAGVERQVNPLDNGATYKNPLGNAPAQRQAGVAAPSALSQAGTLLYNHTIKPVQQQAVGLYQNAPIVPVIKADVAGLTGNNVALQNAQKDLKARNKTFYDALNNHERTPQGKLKYNPTLGNIAMGLEGGGLESVAGKGAEEVAAAGKAVSNPKVTIKSAANASKLKAPTADEIRANQVFDQNPLAVKTRSTPAVEPVDNNLLTTMDKVIANSGGTPQDAARIRINAQRSLEGETAALAQLNDGGQFEDAVKAYKQQTGTTDKNARFQVKRAAKQAKVALARNPKDTNPLQGEYKLPEAQPGQYDIAPRNQTIVNANIELFGRKALSYEKKLSDTDKAGLVDYAQGTKSLKHADNPEVVQQAIDASRKLFNVTHALDSNFNNTQFIKDYFPQYWKNIIEQPKKAQMAAEEAAVANHNIPTEDLGNYNGFRNKDRVFASQKEGRAAGFIPLHENPFDDLRRYINGAKINVGNQAFKRAVHQAQGIHDVSEIPESPGQVHTVDLPGSDFVRVNKQGAKLLKNYGVKKPGGVIRKAFHGVNTTVIKTIVANPIFHGGNQEFNAVFQAAWRLDGNKIANMATIVKDQAALHGPEFDNWREAYYRDGGFSPDYGRDRYGFIAKGLQKIGVDPKNAELSPRAMAAIDERIRVSIYKTAVDQGMEASQAVKVIDKTLGGADLVDDMASAVGLFTHYLKTNVKLLGDIGVEAAHGNVAPLAGLAVGYAAWMAANKAWQQATGNQNANVRAPGVLGVAGQIVKAPGQIKNGQVPSIVTNHLNPAIVTGVEQALNRDVHKPVFGATSDTNTLGGVKGRLDSVGRNLFGPGQTVNKTMSGKSSIPESGLSFGLGLYTPHAKDNVASPKLKFLNTKGATNADGKDPTGYSQQSTYFKTTAQAKGSLPSDRQALYDQLTKSTTKLNDKQLQEHYAGLASNPDILKAITKQKQDYAKATGTKLDPLFSNQYTDEQRAQYYHMQTLDYKGQEYVHEATKYTWLQGLYDARSAYFDSSNFKGADKIERVQPPKFSADVENQLNTADGLDGAEKADYISAHPGLQAAYSQLATYTNDKRIAQGNDPFKTFQPASADVQKNIDTYNSLPKNDGPKGGNMSRSLWIENHPDAWAQMTAYFGQASMYNIEKDAGQAQYQGAEPSQKLLKAIMNTGTYDIVKNPDGSYAMAGSSGVQSGGQTSSDAAFAKSSSGSSSSTSRRKAGKMNDPYPLEVTSNAKPTIKKAKVAHAQKAYHTGTQKAAGVKGMRVASKGKYKVSLKRHTA